VISLWLPRFATDRRRRRQCRSGAPADARAEAAPFVLLRAERGALALAAVDAAAAAAGLYPGLPLADAQALLPGLRSAEEDPEAERRDAARLAAWCGRYTPWSALDGQGREPGGGTGILLDVTGCAHLFGGERALIADLVTRVARLGYAARAALADTPGAAWALARFATDAAAPFVVVAPGEARAALAPLPPAALRLPPARVELMERLGLTRIGHLYDIPPATLEPRFGRCVARRLAQALGATREPISPRRPAPPPLARCVFAEPVVTAEAIAQGLERLTVDLCARLEATQEGARRLELRLYRVDGTLDRLTLGVSRPSRDPAHLGRLFAGRLERIDPGFGIEVMTLAAAVSEPLSALQLALGDRRPLAAGTAAGAGRLAELVDRLGARLGLDQVFALAPRDGHLPERAVGPVAPHAAAPWPVRPAHPPRPLRLFARPEPVEAIALLPDHPPVQFRWRRVRHRVRRAEGPERISAEWWRAEAGEGAGARDYFRVEDEDGRRFWLARADGRWTLHGLFG